MTLKSRIVSEIYINTSTIKLKEEEFLNKEFCMLIFVALYGLGNFHGLIMILSYFVMCFSSVFCLNDRYKNINDIYICHKKTCPMLSV